jgi:hypothetical protein
LTMCSRLGYMRLKAIIERRDLDVKTVTRPIALLG